ncbi:MAG: ribonuclease N [Actinophytocola sp.]|uniref:ribonuclease domain-containing protein n=1 Tax=Actinophytocola sp. TaxID=1872138 RepID=UPI00132B09A6|nr:ribonuclease domain-containing protein [Actinophytocola sp.]MPZ81211.1 ribonuclease N [Actinophytocola sp.]
MGSSRRITVALVGLVVLVLAGWFVRDVTSGDDTAAVPGADSGLPVRALSDLPDEADGTWRLIERGGPYPHEQDGATFGNRERLLPTEKTGYYHEYTVETPGSDDRGQRRMVTGSDGELYYTEDHYTSFVVVDPQR